MEAINNRIPCKHCGTTRTIKYGKYKNTQMYFCNSCKRRFQADDSLFGMRVKADYIAGALDDYYRGLSIRDISDHLYQQHGYRPSKHVVFNWVDKYTTLAANHFRDFKPKVGDTWIADETVIDLDKNRNIWFWDIIDADTRFLLASRVSETRTTQDAQILMEQAAKKAGKVPKRVLTDKLAAYLDGIDLAFGGESEHIQTSPFAGYDSTSKIERWHNTIKERTKVMRAFRNTETLLQFADGFIAFYNFMRQHEGIGSKTPAEAAGIEYEAKTWGKLVRLPVAKGEGRHIQTDREVLKPEYIRGKGPSAKGVLGYSFASKRQGKSKVKPSKARRTHKILKERLRRPPSSMGSIRGGN